MSNVQFTRDLNLWPGVTGYLPVIVKQGNPNQTHGAASTVDVTGATVTVPKGHFGPGTTFRFTLSGSRTGTAGAATVLIDINGTTVSTIAVPTNTAVNWMAQFTIAEHTDFAHQNCSGYILASATVLSAQDTAAGTVNVSNQSVIKARLTLASASDTVIVNHFLIEAWQV